jgi:hypothetical protein
MNLHRPSLSLVLASLAVVASLGGSAYAGKKIGTRDLKTGAVTSGKIKDHDVKGRDLATDSVDGGKVKDGSLGRGEFAPGSFVTGSAAILTRTLAVVDAGYRTLVETPLATLDGGCIAGKPYLKLTNAPGAGRMVAVQQGDLPGGIAGNVPAGTAIPMPIVKSPAFVRIAVAEPGTLLTATVLVEDLGPSCRFSLEGQLGHE